MYTQNTMSTSPPPPLQLDLVSFRMLSFFFNFAFIIVLTILPLFVAYKYIQCLHTFRRQMVQVHCRQFQFQINPVEICPIESEISNATTEVCKRKKIKWHENRNIILCYGILKIDEGFLLPISIHLHETNIFINFRMNVKEWWWHIQFVRCLQITD